jgi:hypothetical protein
MIFCLVTIPLAALFGTSLPDIVKTLGWGKTPVAENRQGGEAPLFVSNVPEAADKPAYTPDEFGRTATAANATDNSPQAAQPSGMQRGIPATQAVFNEPAPAFNGAPAPGNFTAMGNLGAAQRPDERPVVPVAVGQSLGQSTDRFEQIQTRLKNLRASYFRLESFGSVGQFYRFQCEVPIGGDGAVRHFEATSINSLEAMETVLADIDRWMKGA